MKIVHVIPRACIFEGMIKRYADELGHECFFYSIKPRFGMDKRSFFALYQKSRKQPESLFVFHRVAHKVPLAMSFLVKDFRYALLYWGEDYYSTFLSEVAFEAHCLAKSPLLSAAHFERPDEKSRPALRQAMDSFIGLLAVKRAAGVSLCAKQFRFLRYFYFRSFGQALLTPQLRFRGYSPDWDTAEALSLHNANAQSLTVLICHSAAASVAPRQTIELLRAYAARWGVRIHIRGFLSYSGGDEAYRDQLAQELVAQADFAASVQFQRSFLSLSDLGQQLQEADVAVFSCLRDEGVSLLTQFVRLGGIVSFNRFSINYDFFKSFAPSKLLTHEQFLEHGLEQLKHKRMLPPTVPPPMVTFADLEELCLDKGKLFLPNLKFLG